MKKREKIRKKVRNMLVCLSFGLAFLMSGISARAGSPVPSVCNDEEWKTLILVNEQRMKNGLSPLSAYAKLQNPARLRAKELIKVFSHTRPDGSTCFTALDKAGITYFTAGENIAYGFPAAADVMDAWMNSTGHRRNILDSQYDHVGIGYYKSKGIPYWTQLFIGGCSADTLAIQNPEAANGHKAGTSINNMGLVAKITCQHGTSYLPVTSSMCKGYDKNASGTQNVTVKILGCTASLKITPAGSGDGKTDEGTGRFTKKTTLKSVTSGKKRRLKLQWNKVSGADGYVVQISMNKRFTKNVKKWTAGKQTYKKTVKVSKKGTYYVRVRAYQKAGGSKVYGSWSNVKRKKVS